jgi:polyisoprenyl-phosphate glycosyltransferase
MTDLSIVIPVYNESKHILLPYNAVIKIMQDHQVDFELIFVDDGSSDDSFVHLSQLAEKDTRVKVIKLLSNCGAHMAIRTGLEHSSSRMGVFLPCDLQEPADLIPKMIKKLKDNVDIVLAVRENREDKLKDKLFSKLFFWIMKTFISSKIPGSGSSMYLLGGRALKAIKEYPERNLTLEGVFILNNFNYDKVKYDRASRTEGESKWTFSNKIKIFIDFFVAYSYFPIRFVSFIGVLFFILGLFWSCYIIARQLILSDLQPGWPMLLSILLLGFGLTNISLGVVAEYLWRTLDESRRRPRFIVEKKLNF